MLDVAAGRQCVIDNVPVLGSCLVPGSTATPTRCQAGATFGRVCTKKQTIFGDQLHLLVTLRGTILDVAPSALPVTAPANANDLPVGYELLAEHTDLDVIGDNASINAPIAAALWEERRSHLLTVPRRNQKQQRSATICRLLTAARQIIETVNDQRDAQFHVETNHAPTFHGLCARLHSKRATHTLCLYLDRLLGRDDFLHIKLLAFPNEQKTQHGIGYLLPNKRRIHQRYQHRCPPLDFGNRPRGSISRQRPCSFHTLSTWTKKCLGNARTTAYHTETPCRCDDQ